MLARSNPAMAFNSLNHYIDYEWVRYAYEWCMRIHRKVRRYYIDYEWVRYAYECTRKDGAIGVDGQTAEAYAANLQK